MTQESVVEPAPEVSEPAPEHYTVGRWQHFPQYVCRHCPYDTLDQAQIEIHVFERHIMPAAPQPVRRHLPLVDRFGNPVEVED